MAQTSNSETSEMISDIFLGLMGYAGSLDLPCLLFLSLFCLTCFEVKGRSFELLFYSESEESNT